MGSITGLGRSPGEGKGYQFQYSGLENVLDCLVHGVTKSWTGLSTVHFHLQTGWQYTALPYSFPNFESVYFSFSGSNCCFFTHIQVFQDTGKVVL